MTPTERTLRARIAADSLHARGGTNTGPARAAFLSKFETEVDPNGQLPPEERARRAKAARSAHFSRMALKSVKSRSPSKSPPVIHGGPANQRGLTR